MEKDEKVGLGKDMLEFGGKRKRYIFKIKETGEASQNCQVS